MGANLTMGATEKQHLGKHTDYNGTTAVPLIDVIASVYITKQQEQTCQ